MSILTASEYKLRRAINLLLSIFSLVACLTLTGQSLLPADLNLYSNSIYFVLILLLVFSGYQFFYPKHKSNPLLRKIDLHFVLLHAFLAVFYSNLIPSISLTALLVSAAILGRIYWILGVGKKWSAMNFRYYVHHVFAAALLLILTTLFTQQDILLQDNALVLSVVAFIMILANRPNPVFGFLAVFYYLNQYGSLTTLDESYAILDCAILMAIATFLSYILIKPHKEQRRRSGSNGGRYPSRGGSNQNRGGQSRGRRSSSN